MCWICDAADGKRSIVGVIEIGIEKRVTNIHNCGEEIEEIAHESGIVRVAYVDHLDIFRDIVYVGLVQVQGSYTPKCSKSSGAPAQERMRWRGDIKNRHTAGLRTKGIAEICKGVTEGEEISRNSHAAQ